jgi:hypothetical protein
MLSLGKTNSFLLEKIRKGGVSFDKDIEAAAGTEKGNSRYGAAAFYEKRI